MPQKPLRRNPDRDATSASVRLAGRMPGAGESPALPATGAKWTLIAAIVLQIGWIAALAAMALLVRWRT